ncbi:MAG: alpha/beta hydrolase [Microbacteriaceae bacterium]
MDFVTNPNDGTRIVYRDMGSGVPIVMVHGSALSQVIWRGFGYVRDLAADHRVITLDLRGHGRSGKPQEASAYAMEFFVTDVLAVLDALAIERAHYLGYSLGGRIGFSLAARHPDRLRSLISAGGASRGEPGAFDRVFFPGCVEILETGSMTAFIHAWEAHSGAALDASTRSAFQANDARALAAYMREADRDPGVSERELAAIELPTLLLVGSDDDERVPAAEHALARMPNATMHVLPGATHGDTLQHPDARPAIRAFLASLEPPLPASPDLLWVPTSTTHD